MLEESLGCDVEAPAESLALAPGLVSVTLYALTEVLSVGAICVPTPADAGPATVPSTLPKNNVRHTIADRSAIRFCVSVSNYTLARPLNQVFFGLWQ